MLTKSSYSPIFFSAVICIPLEIKSKLAIDVENHFQIMEQRQQRVSRGRSLHNANSQSANLHVIFLILLTD